MWFLKKNRKGQAIAELVIVMNIMLMMFFAMILFSVYVYDKMIVVYAANLAIDEAIGKAGEKDNLTSREKKEKLEGLMRGAGHGALDLGIFLVEPSVDAHVEKPDEPDESGNIKGYFSVTVSAKYSMKLPFVSEFLNDNVITSTGKVDYIW